jgi:hypothetical protein
MCEGKVAFNSELEGTVFSLILAPLRGIFSTRPQRVNSGK